MPPGSSKIGPIAKDIAESKGVTCTAAQKTDLDAALKKLDSLIKEAKEKLEALQAQLEELTSTTAVINTTPLFTTTAARMRMKGFIRQFMM